MEIFNKIQEEIQQDYYQQNYSNDGQRFVSWYLRNVHLRDRNQAKYDISDGPDDKQIDAVVIDDDSSLVYIIQGKFIGESNINAEPLREVISSWLRLKDLVKLQETGNVKLKQKLVDVSNALEDDYAVIFELITTGNLTENASEDLKYFQENLAIDEELPASFHLVNNEELVKRYESALDIEKPYIDHSLELETGKYLSMEIAGTDVIVAAIPLKECVAMPGIRDGSLFRKNVRQFMGLNNRVNKSIKSTIYSDRHRDFFFYHNGITAICNKIEKTNSKVKLNGLCIINGCQSLNTILAASEQVKELEGTYILFRFYEIPQRDRAERISISTNLQTAVKPRDLRSNDKRVLNLKRLFEQRYSMGYFTTKRGEEPPADKDKSYAVDLVDLGKWLISWHSQRPNMAYSETKIFDKYFEQLFRREYDPENIQALNFWMQEIMKGWVTDNPFSLNESLLAMKAYVPYHALFTVSQFFAIASNHSDRVPSPKDTIECAQKNSTVEQVVNMSANCLNIAIETAANEQTSLGKIFSPQNWIKTKTCLSGIKTAVTTQLMMLPTFPGGRNLKDALIISKEFFEYRWEAD